MAYFYKIVLIVLLCGHFSLYADWNGEEERYSSYRNRNLPAKVRKKSRYVKKREYRQRKIKSRRTYRKTKSSKRYKKNRRCNKNYKIYRVRRGDTLFGIAKRFKISHRDISSLNRIAWNCKVWRGMRLKIPAKKRYHTKNNNKKYVKRKRLKSPGFIWPLKKIVRYKREFINGVKPIGIVITTRSGSRVRSAATGVVKKVGQMRGFGKYIVVTHKNRYATVYANLGKIDVYIGQRVSVGKVIGKTGIRNNKIHFQIDYKGKPKNPLKFLPRHG